MYVIKKLQLNRFKAVPVVTNRQQAIAAGINSDTKEENPSKDTIECAGTATILGANKLQMLALGQEMARAAYLKHKTAGASADMPNVPANRK